MIIDRVVLMNLNNIKKVLITLLLTFFSLHIFIFDIEVITLDGSDMSLFYQFFQGLFLSMKPFNFKLILIFILFYCFFYKAYFSESKKNNFYRLLSFIFSLITIVGLVYSTLASSLKILFCSFLQIYKFLTLFFGYYIIYYAILKRLSTIDIGKIKMKETFFERKFQKHPILITSLLLTLVFLPLAIIFYPGGATGDTADSVYQFFHDGSSWSIQMINLIDDNVYINKHHSVLFTVMLGLFLKLGNCLYSYNLGFFLFILFQLFVVISIFSFMIYYMKRIKIPFYLIFCSILFICFSPLIIKYSITAIKDTLNAGINLVYVIFLLQIVRNYDSIFKNKFRLFAFIIVMLLVMMLRNNGIYTILLSFPFLFILYKKYWRKLLKVFVSILIIFGMYDNILLPRFGVSDGSIKEVLSIPFMQLARVAKYHEEDFSNEEINKINEVLDFRNIINGYNPKISDDVKDSYKKTATKQEILDVFGIWFKYLKKYPDVYIESFLNSTYGYFYPPFIEDEPKILFTNFLAYERNYELGPISRFNVARAVIYYVLCYIYYSPFFVYFNNVALIDWLLVLSFLYIFRKKKYKYLIPLFPLLSVLLVCLASPVNGCARYVLSIVFSVPIVLAIDYIVYVESKR